MNDDPPPATGPLPSRNPDLTHKKGQVESTGDQMIRWGAAVTVLLVTGIAAVISYGHAYRLVTRYGEAGATAKALPLTVDGLVATCSLVILYYTRKDRRAPWHAWGLLITGVCATVGANVANGLGHGLVGAIVAGWPALVAVGSFELLIRLLRDGRPTRQLPAQPTTGTPATPARQQTEPVAEPLEGSAERSSIPEIPASAPLSQPEPAVLAATERYADDLADGRVPSIRQIKREMQVGHPKASRIHSALTQRLTSEPTAELRAA